MDGWVTATMLFGPINIVSLKDYFINNLVSFCPLECNKTDFSIKTSALELKCDKYFLEHINDNDGLKVDFNEFPISKEKLLKSFVSLSIFYESLAYTLSTESPQMDIVALLGNIGGTLGLFLGVSLLHLCEVIEVIIEIIFIKTDKKVHISL